MANTPEWRARVHAELAKRPRGEQARIVEYVRRWYPKFSTGTLTTTLADDEKPGQARWSKYVELISRYLWPDALEQPVLNEQLARALSTASDDEQRALAPVVEAVLAAARKK